VTSSLKYRIMILILFPAVIFLALMDYKIWSHLRDPADGVTKKSEVRAEKPSRAAAVTAKDRPPPAESYMVSVIAEKNIFSPDRKDSHPLTPSEFPSATNRPIVRPQAILCGVIIADDSQSACVSSPGRPLRNGERETLILKPGDRIEEYRLAKISPDRITMETAADSFQSSGRSIGESSRRGFRERIAAGTLVVQSPPRKGWP
jgi:hypothetical protein